VQASCPSARLAVLGRGPLLNKLRKAARPFGDRLLVPGAVFGEQLKGWYARANVYWTASRTENFSAGILESLASGTPVVAAAAGGNTEQVQNGISGFLVPVNNACAMAERTMEILKNPELQRCMSIAARERALELSLENATDRLLVYLHAMIDRSRMTAAL
jgi:glycosyltransferase involved in cell wall biosynthesis